MTAHEHFLRTLMQIIPKWIKKANLQNDEIIITILPEAVEPCLIFLQNHTNTQYKILIDICGVDFTDRKKRFEVVYNLLSIKYNSRITIKLCVDEITPIMSISNVYSSAIWFEREIWDMFGIFFSNHPDLRRILTDYGFEGHPLRKDFPLSGYCEVRYDDTEKRVINVPIQMTQEFRMFKFLSPWQDNLKIKT
jgi:NADH dehydrogenase (ubiquinone) Fe-S protein 3